MLLASFFELINVAVVAVSGVRAAGVAVICGCVDELLVFADDDAAVARRYASDLSTNRFKDRNLEFFKYLQ